MSQRRLVLQEPHRAAGSAEAGSSGHGYRLRRHTALAHRYRRHQTARRLAAGEGRIHQGLYRRTGGYLYTTFDPFYFYDVPQPLPATSAYFQPRNEITAGVSSRWDHYRFTVSARRNLATNQMISYGATAAYEDECFILDVRFTRRFTSLLGDNGSTALLFFFTFKTVGQFGYRAI